MSRTQISTIKQAWIFVVPIALYFCYVVSDPFRCKLCDQKIPVSSLTVQQKLNIHKVAAKIDGIVLRPDEEFSFNGRVGPRTVEKGYFQAPSYIGTGSYSTPGGGICVISSALYQDALLAGLTVTERVAHNRTMLTVAPGLDATVWYGGADLKFKNTSNQPVQIHCAVDDEVVTVSLHGQTKPVSAPILTTRELPSSRDQIAVEVLLTKNSNTKVISRDVYTLHSPGRTTRS
ncbi:MAG TPA: VanW family protein [Oculatellaceae cyanobacterium]